MTDAVLQLVSGPYSEPAELEFVYTSWAILGLHQPLRAIYGTIL
jgi:hypothetical protein